ncbi:MAG TPA: hypothetical protein VJ820_08715 [Propionibacteriaceae bacterium]|nr:hypothetical protein [Propionibacteriaceae bacterium]
MTTLRISPAAWFAVPMAIATVLYSAAYQPATSDGYSVALTAAGTVTMSFIAPFVAVSSAWEASRLRRAGWWGAPHVRSHLTIALWSIAPAVAAGSLALVLSVAAQFRGFDAVVPDLRLVATDLVVIVAHAVAGFALGLRLPIVVAGPIAVIGSYAWMAVPRALEPLWIRHLTGSFEACCLLQEELAPHALVGALLVASGLMAAALIVIARGWLRGPIAAAIGSVAIGFGSGALIVSGLGASPAVPRDTADLVCRSRASTELCVWREHADRLNETMQLLSTARSRWQAEGIEVPTVFTEESERDGAASFGFSLAATRDDLLHGLAYAVAAPWPPCAESEPYPGGMAVEIVHAWLDYVGGMSVEDIAMRLPAETGPGNPTPAEAVHSLSALSLDERSAWLSANLAAIRQCGILPRPIPS